MEKENLNKIKNLLLDMEKDLSDRKDEPLVIEKLPDAIDAAIEDSERSFAAHLNNRRFSYLKKVRSALKKIENDCFGLCDECGSEIELNRLLARPTADYCLDCKSEIEKLERKEKSRGGMLDSWDNQETEN